MVSVLSAGRFTREELLRYKSLPLYLRCGSVCGKMLQPGQTCSRRKLAAGRSCKGLVQQDHRGSVSERRIAKGTRGGRGLGSSQGLEGLWAQTRGKLAFHELEACATAAFIRESLC